MVAVITLREVYQDFKTSRSLKAKTLTNYDYRLEHCFSDWLDLDIRTISKDMVETRHKSIAGYSMANSAFKTLKTVLNYALVKYEEADKQPYLKVNPVVRLSQVRGWHRDKRRQTLIRPKQLPAWFDAVCSLWSTTARDYFITVVLTGMRRNEALQLKWADVDLERDLITLRDTKNGDTRIVPISTYFAKLLSMRKLHTAHGTEVSQKYVFATKQNSARPVGITILYRAQQDVIARSGVKFCVHDLRRTYITMGDEIDEQVEVVQSIVGHRNNSMTESYIVRSVERLRATNENINKAILQAGYVKTNIALVHAQ